MLGRVKITFTVNRFLGLVYELELRIGFSKAVARQGPRFLRRGAWRHERRRAFLSHSHWQRGWPCASKAAPHRITRMHLSIVTTLYKSARHLAEFHARITAAAKMISSDYEIIMVNDGSPDDSQRVAMEICERDPLASVESTRMVYRSAKSEYLLWRPVKGNSHIEVTMGHDVRQICYDIKNLIEYAKTHRARAPSLPRVQD